MDENITDQIPGGLFSIIKERHGNTVYGRCKDFVNGHRKLATLTNRRIFLLRCRRERIFPNHIIHNINQIYSLKVEEHPFRNEVGKILCRFRNSILNVEIKITIWNLRKTNQKLRESDIFLANLLSPNLVNSLRTFAGKTLDRVLLKTRDNNIRKLDNLLRTQKPTVNLVNSDDYIKNYTDVVLPDNVKSVLALGPKHGIPPFKFPTLEVIKDIESCISVSPCTDEIKNKYRIRCINTINNYKNNPVGGRLQQTPTVKQLKDTNNFVRDHPELIISSSDKGNTTVIMYRGEYLEEAHRMLSDSEVYVLLTADPTKLYQDNVNKILKKFKEESMITAEEYKKLIRHNGISPRLYFLRKTHKEGLSLRPISDNINSPTYNIGKFLHQILSQVLSTSPYNAKNSFDLKRDLQGVHVPEGYILVSLDVVSLFTYISKELVITVVKKQWNYIKNFTNLSRECFLNLVDVCFECSYFVFNGKFYRQILGSAMGSPSSPSFANLVMDDLFSWVLSIINFHIPMVKLYVDDAFLIIPNNKKQQLLDLFNSYDDKLKFTMEVQVENSIPFLDILIKKEDNTLKTCWYYKPSNSNRLVNFFSNHSTTQKINVINNLISRALKLSDEEYHRTNLSSVKKILTQNNYPIYLINRSIKKIQNRRGENTLSSTSGDSTKSFHRLPFIDGLSYKIQKILRELNCTCAFYNVSTTNRFFSKLKEPTKKELMSSVVYKIPCLDCDRSYMGQTRQYLKERIKQHKYDIRNINNKEKTALTYHVFGEGHNFGFGDVEILDVERNGYKRNISEMVSIRSNNTVNFREDVNNLSYFYDILLDIT